jgi:hypothetical protein
MPDTFKTGKKNRNQVGQYVYYNNMETFWNCVHPSNSQDPNEYNETVDFPACKHFDRSWSDDTAKAMGYVKPFASDWSNRIKGTDGNIFGRPVTSQDIQIFSYDIYRSGFMGYRFKTNDWYGVELKRYGIRERDMWNSTMNPSNVDYYAFGWSGVENLTICMNLPVFVSFPHFLYADERYVNSLVRSLFTFCVCDYLFFCFSFSFRFLLFRLVSILIHRYMILMLILNHKRVC